MVGGSSPSLYKKTGLKKSVSSVVCFSACLQVAALLGFCPSFLPSVTVAGM